MNTIDNSSPVRDITAWAESEDGPPADLFDGTDSYRMFVRRWRILYRYVSHRLRVSTWKGRTHNWSYWPALKEYKATYKSEVRAHKKAHYEAVLKKMQEEFPTPPEDFKLLVAASGTERSLYVTDATQLLQIRKAGKRWARTHLKWEPRFKSSAA